MISKREQVLKLIREKGIVRARDMESLGVSRMMLQRLHEEGVVERVGRGQYALLDTFLDEYSDLIQVANRAPKSVICLISALDFHQITTQLPYEVWIAIEATGWAPQMDYPNINVVRFSGEAFHHGIETHMLNQTPVRVYSVAKTLADCFKFRNRIGMDVVLEALRMTIRHKKATIQDIWMAANVTRMKNVMRPYLEAME